MRNNSGQLAMLARTHGERPVRKRWSKEAKRRHHKEHDNVVAKPNSSIGRGNVWAAPCKPDPAPVTDRSDLIAMYEGVIL